MTPMLTLPGILHYVCSSERRNGSWDVTARALVYGFGFLQRRFLALATEEIP